MSRLMDKYKMLMHARAACSKRHKAINQAVFLSGHWHTLSMQVKVHMQQQLTAACAAHAGYACHSGLSGIQGLILEQPLKLLIGWAACDIVKPCQGHKSKSPPSIPGCQLLALIRGNLSNQQARCHYHSNIWACSSSSSSCATS